MAEAPGPAAAKTESRDVVNSILLMIAFALIAPGVDVFAKLAAQTVPPGEITFFRFAIQATILLPLVIWRGHHRGLTTRVVGLHALRGALIAIAIVCFITAIRLMPLADAIAIFFVEPLILTLLGALVLGEPVGWRRVAACAAGFVGALIVVRPSFEDFGWVAALPLATALSFSAYLLLTRTLSQREDPFAMQAYAGFFAAVFIAIALWLGHGSGSPVFDPVWPDGRGFLLVACTGVLATFSHLLVVYAFRKAPASTLAPLQYLEIVTATILSYLVFGDFPDALKWLGIAIIVGSGLFVFWRENSNLGYAAKT